MEPPLPRIPAKSTRHSNVVESTSVKQMLKQLVRLSLQETESPGKVGLPSASVQPLDIRAKYLQEYRPEGKSQGQVRKKKNILFREASNFELRFHFYDRILPIFIHCSLSNKTFFRTLSLIERTLLNKKNEFLDHWQKKELSAEPIGDDIFFGYWLHTIALPCLFTAIDAEETVSQDKERQVVSFLPTVFPGMTPQAVLGIFNLKLTLFVTNNCDVDQPTHYDVLCEILVEKSPIEKIWMLREVVEKVLLVSLCYDYEVFQGNKDTVCRAAIQFCLIGVHEDFQKYFKNDSGLTGKERARVKDLWRELKKLQKPNQMINHMIGSFSKNFDAINESPENWNFKNWKFAQPVTEDSSSEEEDSDPDND